MKNQDVTKVLLGSQILISSDLQEFRQWMLLGKNGKKKSISNCFYSGKCVRSCKEQNAVAHFRIVPFPFPDSGTWKCYIENCEKYVEC